MEYCGGGSLQDIYHSKFLMTLRLLVNIIHLLLGLKALSLIDSAMVVILRLVSK